jgi:hypothetical protein
MMAKYLTKLIIAGEGRAPAKTYPLDFESDSAELAGHACIGHWSANWADPEPTTETVVYVQKYEPNGLPESSVSFVIYWSHDACREAQIRRRIDERIDRLTMSELKNADPGTMIGVVFPFDLTQSEGTRTQEYYTLKFNEVIQKLRDLIATEIKGA